MTDEKYVFIETSKERKNIGRSAYKKKGGSRSKRCSLPSDRLTEKQRKELNGPVESWNLSKRMSWGEFKRMPKDLQKEYLRKLVSEHDARLKDVAGMFGINSPNVLKHISKYLDGEKFFAAHPPRGVSSKWLAFMLDDEQEAKEVPAPVEEEKAPQNASCEVKQPLETQSAEELLHLLEGSVRMEGRAEFIFAKALAMLDPSAKYEITIQFCEV